jgi:type II secretory pathway pseudopilin PulG
MRQRGASLVSIIVALGILGIFATVAARWFGNSQQISSKLDDLQAREELRQYIRTHLSCEKTIEKFPTACKLKVIPSSEQPAERVAIYSRSKKTPPLVPASDDGLKIGKKYRLRSYCKNTEPGKLYVEVSYKNGPWKPLYKKSFVPDCSGFIF